MTHAWTLPAFGASHLSLTERPPVALGPGEVRLRMTALALNYRDLRMIAGVYNPRQPLPLVPGSDGVGKVLEIGPGVTRVSVGERVVPSFFQGWFGGAPTKSTLSTSLGGPLPGSFAEEMVLSEHGVVPVPAYLTDEEAATVPCAGVTAWSALVRHQAVKAGDVVLVQGTGGVSMFALQLATVLGARVVVTSRSDEKLARARDLGAWGTVNYVKEPEWSRAARKLTEGLGVHHVVEVGGAGTFEQSVRSLRPGGTVSVIGVLSGTAPPVNLLPILMQGLRAQGIIVGPREALEDVLTAMEAHTLRPMVDRVFPWSDLPAALAHMEKGAHFGKIVLKVA